MLAPNDYHKTHRNKLPYCTHHEICSCQIFCDLPNNESQLPVIIDTIDTAAATNAAVAAAAATNTVFATIAALC